jgi:glycosyltransferase 2 family protein
MRLKFLIKLIISALMLFLVFRAADLEKLKSTLLAIPPWITLTVIIGYLIGQILSSLKWWIIAKHSGIDASYTKALQAYFIGMFVNCFGLGIVGGDVARGILLSQGKPQKTPAIASVVADRLHGLVVLTLIAACSWLFIGNFHLSEQLILIICTTTFCILLAWFLGPSILLRIINKESKFRRKAEQLSQVFPKSPKILLTITVLSFFFHFLQISLHYVMGLGVGLDISWQILLTTIPIVNILSSLPISWQGLGVREKSYVYFLAPAILQEEQALVFGAMWLLAVTFASAIGGIVAVLSKDYSELLKKTTPKEDTIVEVSLNKLPN